MKNTKEITIDEGFLAEKFDDLLLKAASAPDGRAFLPTSQKNTVSGWPPELRRELGQITTRGYPSKIQAILHRIEDLGREVSLRRAKRPNGEMGVLITLSKPRRAPEMSEPW